MYKKGALFGDFLFKDSTVIGIAAEDRTRMYFFERFIQGRCFKTFYDSKQVQDWDLPYPKPLLDWLGGKKKKKYGIAKAKKGDWQYFLFSNPYQDRTEDF